MNRVRLEPVKRHVPHQSNSSNYANTRLSEGLRFNSSNMEASLEDVGVGCFCDFPAGNPKLQLSCMASL